MKNLVVTIYVKNEPSRLKDGKAPVYFKLKANNTITTFPANCYVDRKDGNTPISLLRKKGIRMKLK